VQLDTVESGLTRAAGRRGEQIGQLFRQLANRSDVHVGHSLARAEAERFELRRAQNVF
jgi:hypothetical protein